MIEIDEIWKAVVDFEEIYKISNLGRIKRIKSRNGYKIDRMLKPMSRGERKYLYVDLCKNGIKKSKQIHRIVLEAFDRLPNVKEECNHINGIKADNRLKNLEWCTRSENELHKNRVLKYESLKGEKHGRSKLTNEEIKTIRHMYKDGLPQREIAKKFNVGQQNISCIVNHKNWKHIDQLPEALQEKYRA